MPSPTPSEEERYKYLMLKKKQGSSDEIKNKENQSSQIDTPTIQKQNKLGQIFNVPGATSRAAIQSNPVLAVAGPLAGIVALSGAGGKQAQQAAGMGAMQPDNVPSFQSLQQNNPIASLLTGGVPIGMAMDIATNPADVLSSLIGKVPGMQQAGSSISKGVKSIFKFESSLKQAQKSKIALDELRDTLGKAKELALSNTSNIPAEVDFSGNMSQKVINAIKNPIYKVEFTPEGGVVNNIGNLDKIKTALNDIVTAKDFVEAGNMEKRQIMQFAGKVRDSMVSAADKAGKPELGKSLRDYHNFMEQYNKINDHLVDKYGDAMANKLKSTFSIFAEPATKQAWKEVSKASPEIKAVMNSMQRRELLKNLLTTGITIEGFKKGVTGHF